MRMNSFKGLFLVNFNDNEWELLSFTKKISYFNIYHSSRVCFIRAVPVIKITNMFYVRKWINTLNMHETTNFQTIYV